MLVKKHKFTHMLYLQTTTKVEFSGHMPPGVQTGRTSISWEFVSNTDSQILSPELL